MRLNGAMDGGARVMVVDDHPYVRASLERLLDSTEDLSFVGAAADGEDAVRMVRRLRPAVVLMDLRMPGVGGLEATRRIVRRWPHTRVVILTSEAPPLLMSQAVAAGAVDVLLKDDPIERILAVVRRAAVADQDRLAADRADHDAPG